MKHRIFSFTTVALGMMVIAAGFSSCKEDITIHSNLTPSTDNIGTDTLVIPDSFFLAKTVMDDSLITSTAAANSHALGYLDEKSDVTPYPVKTTAGIYVQIVPTSTGFSYAAGNVIDSAVLVLPYAGYTWGDTTIRSAQTVKAYEISDTLANTTPYYTFTQKNYKPAELGSATYYTGPAGSGVISDSVTIRRTSTTSSKVAPHLRIRLSQTFLDNFNNNTIKSDSTFAIFLNALRGFYIQPDVSAGKAMAYFKVTGNSDYYGQINMLVYAHKDDNDSIVYQFPYNSTYTAHYNKIKREWASQNLFAANNPELMVQNQPGAAIDLTIKNLRDIKTISGTALPPNIVINKVALILTEINEYANLKYTRPPRIYPIGIDANSTKYGIVDRYNNYSTRDLTTDDGLNFIDGTPVISTAPGAGTVVYNVNFPREFQQSIIQKKSELHLRINGTQTYPGAYRLIVGNKNNSNANYRYALRIIYSKQN